MQNNNSGMPEHFFLIKKKHGALEMQLHAATLLPLAKMLQYALN
jgi:hypothetical protein